MNINTGNYVALAGLIVFVLGHFGIIVEEAQIITVISGLVTLYGIIHQAVVTRKVAGIARGLGAKI